jgi:hypothetical protein
MKLSRSGPIRLNFPYQLMDRPMGWTATTCQISAVSAQKISFYLGISFNCFLECIWQCSSFHVHCKWAKCDRKVMHVTCVTDRLWPESPLVDELWPLQQYYTKWTWKTYIRCYAWVLRIFGRIFRAVTSKLFKFEISIFCGFNIDVFQ